MNMGMCYLYDRVQKHNARFLGYDLFGCVVMIYELWDGGEASAFKSVLVLWTQTVTNIKLFFI